jgi:hypothetical protein
MGTAMLGFMVDSPRPLTPDELIVNEWRLGASQPISSNLINPIIVIIVWLTLLKMQMDQMTECSKMLWHPRFVLASGSRNQPSIQIFGSIFMDGQNMRTHPFDFSAIVRCPLFLSCVTKTIYHKYNEKEHQQGHSHLHSVFICVWQCCHHD